MSTDNATRYTLESNRMVFAPNIVRYAIEHYANDPAQAVAIVTAGWEGVTAPHAHALLAKAVPYTVEAEAVVFTVDEDDDDTRHAVAALTWEGPTDSDGEPCFYVNHYRCRECNNDWTDQWSCACDDECSGCGKDFSPIESVDVTESQS